MLSSMRRFKTRVIRNGPFYLRCGVKTITFLFWALSYMFVMKLTVFNNSPEKRVKRYQTLPDNDTRWLAPIRVDDSESEMSWAEPDNATIIELEQRVTNVQRVCRERAINQIINSKEFFVNHKHNLVWCTIFKAASSSWLYKFNILGGYEKKFLAETRDEPLNLARRKYPRPSADEVRDAINTPGVVSFIVVRDPFVRLLSAFRDKLEKTRPFYKKMARAIVKYNRDKTNKIFGINRNITPTFYEFISYLVNKHNDKNFKFDEHWAPYYRFCSPCAVNFSVIAKVETIRRDSAYVINQLGLGHVLYTPVQDRRTRFRKVMNMARDGKNTTALLKHYFNQLDQKLFDGLLEIYGIDFEMFGYDPSVYKKYIKK